MEDTAIAYVKPTDDGWILVDEWGAPINDETYQSPDGAIEAAPWYGYTVDRTDIGCEGCCIPADDEVPF
jgi:hypothetical protein